MAEFSQLFNIHTVQGLSPQWFCLTRYNLPLTTTILLLIEPQTFVTGVCAPTTEIPRLLLTELQGPGVDHFGQAVIAGINNNII